MSGMTARGVALAFAVSLVLVAATGCGDSDSRDASVRSRPESPSPPPSDAAAAEGTPPGAMVPPEIPLLPAAPVYDPPAALRHLPADPGQWSPEARAAMQERVDVGFVLTGLGLKHGQPIASILDLNQPASFPLAVGDTLFRLPVTEVREDGVRLGETESLVIRRLDAPGLARILAAHCVYLGLTEAKSRNMGRFAWSRMVAARGVTNYANAESDYAIGEVWLSDGDFEAIRTWAAAASTAEPPEMAPLAAAEREAPAASDAGRVDLARWRLDLFAQGEAALIDYGEVRAGQAVGPLLVRDLQKEQATVELAGVTVPLARSAAPLPEQGYGVHPVVLRPASPELRSSPEYRQWLRDAARN